MKKHSKRYRKNAALVDAKKRYDVATAVGILKKFEGMKFDQTVDVSFALLLDVKKAEQALRGAVSLPHGIGKARKVVVFAEGADAEAALGAGADEVGSDDLAKKVEGGWMDFDVAIAVPAMMKKISRLGKVLGPQGKMPSPKNGTVTENVTQAVREFKAGKIEYRADAGGNVMVAVGKVSFPPEKLKDNVSFIVDHIRGVKPAGLKGNYFRKVVLSGTMTPGIVLDVQ
ncbi:MAG: large subunit ribosomal protein [Planctomycetota bacterium]|nr:MAG: large subunit ribosomal protein [Planctomycetota bacterium]